MKYKIGFFGAGKMAEGILSAIKNKREVLMGEKVSARAEDLKKKYGVAVTASLKEVAENCETIFLAVRPQEVGTVAGEVKGRLCAKQTLVSIVAGKKLSSLKKEFGAKVKLIRVMPNLALRAGAGMCAITDSNEIVEKILGAAGEVVVLKEKDFDAVTALSGSGPAYFAYMQQTMTEGGIALGLKPSVARLLSAQTMYGTARFLKQSGMELGAFIDGVCTKGGTTAAGMSELAKRGTFRRVVAKTLAAAARRSRELAGK